MRELTRWEPGQRVESCHPAWPGGTQNWLLGTVVRQVDAYVTVRPDGEDHDMTTYHLNVREPGAPDPVNQLSTSA